MLFRLWETSKAIIMKLAIFMAPLWVPARGIQFSSFPKLIFLPRFLIHITCFGGSFAWAWHSKEHRFKCRILGTIPNSSMLPHKVIIAVTSMRLHQDGHNKTRYISSCLIPTVEKYMNKTCMAVHRSVYLQKFNPLLLAGFFLLGQKSVKNTVKEWSKHKKGLFRTQHPWKPL